MEGQPVVSKLNKINIGASVEAQLKRDLEAEADAIKSYNDGIRLCLELGDNGSRELIEDNLEDEEEHLDWLEAQLDQISQMGLPNYLLSQISESATKLLDVTFKSSRLRKTQSFLANLIPTHASAPNNLAKSLNSSISF